MSANNRLPQSNAFHGTCPSSASYEGLRQTLRVVGRTAPWILLLFLLGSGDVGTCGQHDSINPRFVAATGNDSADGTASAPWRTLQHAADRVVAGEKVHVLAGRYAGFQLTRSGTAGRPIMFHGEAGAVIDSPHPGEDGINLEGASYILIEGFEVTGAGRAGIRSVVNHNVTIRNNRTDQNGMWGIFAANSDFIAIEHNVTSRSRVEHGIYVSSATDHALVRGNTVWGNHVNGIHLNSGKDQLVTAALVEGNVIYENGADGGSGINADGIQSSVIQNNLLYGNHGSGISLYRDTGDKAAFNNAVLNNTVVQASDGRWALNIQNASSGTAVFNNILLHENNSKGSICIGMDCLEGLRSNHNVVSKWFTTNRGAKVIDMLQWRATTKGDRDSIVATSHELFINAAAHDYRLSNNSPAAGAGTPYRTPADDLEGTPRRTGQWDIGAYQGNDKQISSIVRKAIDSDGPQLIKMDPSGQILAPLDNLRLRFSEELRLETLDEKSLSIDGPSGTVPILRIEPANHTEYLVKFAKLTTSGSYTLAIAPSIKDLVGNQLNQIGNGVSAQKDIRRFVVKFQLVDSYKFSFGPRMTPPPDGYIRVSETTGYSPSRGYGWLNGGIQSVNTEEGPALTRTLDYGPAVHFAVAVPTGNYDLTLTMGNSKYAHDKMALSLQGKPVETIDTAVGKFHVKTYRVSVANQKLELLLRDLGGSDPNVVINSLIVAPVVDESNDASRQERP